jgi:sugar lactone lactonase YvrE
VHTIARIHATPISRRAYSLGESPRYDAAREELIWVDIDAGRLLRADPEHLDDVTETTIDDPLGAAAPAIGGGWILAAGRGVSELTTNGVRTALLELEPVGIRMNDAACDHQGRFWVGTVSLDERPGAGRLYRVDPGGGATMVLSGLTIANGLGWSPDGATMYHADSGPGTITAYDFDADSGQIERPRVIVRTRRGVPDGLTVDDEGLLWVALFGGASVVRYDPAGRPVARIPLPVSQPTCCALVGTRLIITTASRDVAATEAEAGRLFAAEVGVTGPPCVPYAGFRASPIPHPDTRSPEPPCQRRLSTT